MEATVNGSISELTKQPNARAGSDADLFAVFSAARAESQVNELAALLESWSQAEQGPAVSDRTIAELYFILATKCTGAKARELCRTALDFCPAHFAALSLFEELVDETWADELCARYLTFIEDAPFHGVPAEARTLVHDKLVRAEQEAALREAGDLPSVASDTDVGASTLRVLSR